MLAKIILFFLFFDLFFDLEQQSESTVFYLQSYSTCWQQFYSADRFPAKEGNLFYQAEPCFL